MSKTVKFKFYKNTSVPRFAAVVSWTKKKDNESDHPDWFVVILPEFDESKNWLKGHKAAQKINKGATIQFFNALEHNWFFTEQRRNIRPMSQEEWDQLYDDCKLKMIMDFITWHSHSHLEYNGLSPDQLVDYKHDV